MIHEKSPYGDRQPSQETWPRAARERIRGPGILANTSGGGSRLSALAIGQKKARRAKGCPVPPATAVREPSRSPQ